jgi:hypothetical protein
MDAVDNINKTRYQPDNTNIPVNTSVLHSIVIDIFCSLQTRTIV